MTTTNDPYYTEDVLRSLEYLDLPVPKKGRIHNMILKDPITQLNAPKPIVLKMNDSVLKASQLMKKHRFGSVLIIEEDGSLKGIFTEKDLLGKTFDQNGDIDSIPLSEVMTPNPQAVNQDDTIALALHLMAVGGYRHVPIVKDGSPVGFCSIRGILRYLSENAPLLTGSDDS